MKPHRVINVLAGALVMIFVAAIGFAEETESAKVQEQSQVQKKEMKQAKAQVQTRTMAQTQKQIQEKSATRDQLQKRERIQEKTAAREQRKEQKKVQKKTANQQKLKTQKKNQQRAFVDRDGDGVCDSYQTQARSRKETKKRHRKNMSACSGCGTGGHDRVMYRGSGRDSATAGTHHNGNGGTTQGGAKKGVSKGKQGK